ncbi:putative reverse transcriptase, RNA-dependent DNA polymerase [Tanacetum coccineum]
MQEELLQFKIQKVWTLVDLPSGKKGIGTKWVYRNKKDEKGIVVRNKARLVAQGYKQEEGIDYDEMDVKSAFLYGTIKEERLKGDILLVQVYVDDIIFGSTKKSLCDEFEQIMQNRSMIGSLMYLTSSRQDIIYLKGQPKLGLWYPKDSPFILEAFSDSDYAGASLDRKSTTGGCQYLGSRLISWQCKNQIVVANSTTEAEYIAASHCCGQVLWIQNQMLDYGFNFMKTKIHVDNESAICVVKNPVSHSKIKHIEIMHHFIRDSYEKRLVKMVKIHIDNNVADLLTKAFNVSIFNFLVASIGKRGQDTKIPQSGGPPIKVGDEAVHKELGDRMERAATTASSFQAELDSGSGPRCQETTLGM